MKNSALLGLDDSFIINIDINKTKIVKNMIAGIAITPCLLIKILKNIIGNKATNEPIK
jgi:hypothetical protein